MYELLAQSIVDGLILGATYALAALGLSLAFGVMHIINVAQGEFVVLGAFIAFWLWYILKLNPIVGSIAIFVILFALGFALQYKVVNRLVGAPPLMSLVFFFGLSIAMSTTMMVVWGPFERSITAGEFLTTVRIGVVTLSVGRIVALALSAIIIAIFTYVLQRTKIGMAIRATAQNRDAAMLCGVNVKLIYAITLGFGVALAGLGGMLIAINMAFSPVRGPIYTLLAFLIVVLGGMGYVPGTIVAGLIMGLVQSVVSVYAGAGIVYLVMFFLLYAILLLLPRGIFGKGI